jgi:2-hydroxyacyl-CoA lyase 1
MFTEAVCTKSFDLAVAESLRDNGVQVVFGVVGIPVTNLAFSIQRVGIQFVGMRNEQAAGYAACAYGFLTGKPGVLLTVSGPGMVHGLAALAHAQVNYLPLILLSGSSHSPSGLAFQELDQINAAKPFVKKSFQLTQSNCQNAISEAVSLCLNSRPGSVYVDVPELLLSGLSTSSMPPEKKTSASLQVDDHSDALCNVLRESRRPVVFVGHIAAFYQLEKIIGQLVETLRIPLVPLPMAKGIIPDSHSLCASAARSFVMKNCDLCLLIGAPMNWQLNFGQESSWNSKCKFVSLNEFPLPHSNLILELHGSMKLTLFSLVQKGASLDVSRFQEWNKAVYSRCIDSQIKMKKRLAVRENPLTFYCAYGVIQEEIHRYFQNKRHPILVSEGANTMDIGRVALDVQEPRCRLDAGLWGTMGVGLGYAIAAAIACPERRVVVFEGDSAFGFSAAECETICRFGLPIVIFVFNNSGIYGRFHDSKENHLPTDLVLEAKYQEIMEAFGGKGFFATTHQELAVATKLAFEAHEPVLINIIIDPKSGSESGRLTHLNPKSTSKL